MRIWKLYLLRAALFALVLGDVASQTAQRPATLLPPGTATAPILSAGPGPIPPATTEVQTVPAIQTQVEVRADPVAQLIAQVENEYQLGQDNYKAGPVEAAKENFDLAFNLLLGSSLDLRSDERLEQEFDRVLDGINGFELQALQEGDGFTEEKSEPAPIDEANEVTFPVVDPNLKAKAEAEVKATHSDLPLMMTDPVAGYISYFSTRGRGTLERALARSGRYDDMIRRVLKEEGVPQDLIYLAQAESGFHPLALSRAGARGMWQFMASRAKGYGLDTVVTDKPVPYDEIKIDYPVDLRLVAECVDASASDLQDLNPSLLRLTTPKDREFELHLPAGTKDRYLTAITAIPPDMRVWWRYHKVVPGDTLSSVARAFHTSPRAIVQANNLDGDENL